MFDGQMAMLTREVADGDHTPNPVAEVQVVSNRERALQATHVRLMQEMKKLDTNVAMFRSRNAKLQDEVLQKEQQIQELTSQLKKMEDSVDELSYMVQMLQYQLSSTMDERSNHPAIFDASKLGAVSLIHDAEVKRCVAMAVRPFGKRLRRIRSDYNALKRFALDRMLNLQRSLQSDGAALLNLLMDSMRPSPQAPPPPPAALSASPTPKHIRFPSFLEPEVGIEKCTQPHLTDGALSALETVVARLTISVGRLSTTAGIPLDLSTASSSSRNLNDQLGNVQGTLSKLQKKVESTAEQLALKLAQEQQEANKKKLRLMEEQEEEIQQRVALCTELLLKAKDDPTARKELSTAFAETEACIATSHKEPTTPLKVDKACQCSGGSGGGSGTKAQENGRGAAASGIAVIVQGTQMVPSAEPSTAASKPPRRAAPAPLTITPGPVMFQRTMENIEKLIGMVPEGSHFRLQLEILMQEAKELLVDDPSRWQPPPVYQACSDDHRAVLAFKQWHLRRRVQLSKQQFIMESFFRSLKGWYSDHSAVVPQGQTSSSPAPHRMNSDEASCTTPSSNDGSQSPSLKPGHTLRSVLDKESTGVDLIHPSAMGSPHHRSFSQCMANARLQPLVQSPTHLSPKNREMFESALSGHPEFTSSPVARRNGDGLNRRRFELMVTGGARQTSDGSSEASSPLFLPSPASCSSPKISTNASFRLTPLRS
eukprot:GGOE01008051.1.p1 GENE.GGOE01008051.1~~GGOE01008051.1.p1  ORF type:complete len:711 (-),score=176.98 GGOE01008051.1:513-2645(-)